MGLLDEIVKKNFLLFKLVKSQQLKTQLKGEMNKTK